MGLMVVGLLDNGVWVRTCLVNSTRHYQQK
jgi:hypothetical protein